MFEKQAGVERFDLIQTFHTCKQEEGKSVSQYVLKMKGYVEQLEHLGYVLPQVLSVGLILNGLTSDFTGFVRNYNMHNMGKTIGELHAMLIEYEKGKGKGKGKGKDKSYVSKPKNPKPNAKEHLEKNDACHHCKEVGHWKRNCLIYLAELMKNKKQVGSASSSSIFTIELFSFPNNSWVYDTGCGTHICITKHGLRGTRKLKQDDESFDQCVSCLSGKMTRKLFPHHPERAIDLLGLIHTDVYGPLRHVSRQAYGIVQQLTPPYTPQHNRVFERRNRTLLDMVRSMMNLTTLPLSFWDYALEAAACILNIIPTKKVYKTPYELWFGKVHNLSYLKSKVRQSRAKAVVVKVSTSSSTLAISSEVAELKDIVRTFLLDKKNQSSAPAPTPAPVNAVEPNCVTCGGAHSIDFESYVKANDAVLRNMQDHGQNVQNQFQSLQIQMDNSTDMLSKFVSSNTALSSGSGTLPSNTITNPKEELKGITTRSGVAYQGPTIPTPSKVVKQGTEVTKDQVQTPSSQSTAPVQPLIVQSEIQTLISEPIVAPVSVLMPNLKPFIPYPSRRDNERRRDHANEQIEKFYEIFKDMSFEISFTDALILMPKFASTLKALIENKEKLSEMARTPMNENCSAVILNKLPRKLRDSGKFLIPCEFPGMDECLALADLGASINLMPLFMWEGLSLLKLTLTCMTLELVDRSVSKPIGIVKDVSFKVGVFHFPADFVVVDFKPDLQVPLILGRCFLKTGRANYNQMTANKIDVIDMACEEYSQEVLGFSNATTSGNPTPYDDPIVSTTSPTLTPFGDTDFLLFEEADAFLGLEDDPNSPKINPFYYESEGDILLLEAILNSKPLPPLSNHEQYMPSFKKELKVCEAKTIKSSVDESLEFELKDLPPHLEYAFLKGDNKLPVIISKELGDKEESALIMVLKSHKRAITWKLTDIQGINTEFCNHKIIMEEDYKPAIQHQRRVNPKIHDVIKKENEKNELIPTRLVTGWRVCIDYRKLNEATRKDHFPLPFMDKILERLARNEYYCFLDGFFGCEDTNLCLNWEKNHFMVKEGIVLGHKISKNGIEVDKAKVDVIAKLPHPTTVKDCIKAFQMLKKKLTEASILIALNWDSPFELMCDASDFAIGAVLSIVHTDHSALKYLFAKKYAKARLLWWVLLLQEFDFKVLDTKGAENLASDHLSRLENPYENVLDPKEINETFPLETLSMVTFRSDSSAPWFADFANYHSGIFIVKDYETPIGCTPYKLVYGKACHLPIKLEHKTYWALKQANFDLAVAGDHQKVQLNELNELRDHAYENSLIYKEKTKRIHDSKIKNLVFNVGDRVLLFNSRLKIFSGKLKTRWSGPFTITKVFPYGTVELSQANKPNFKVNGHRVKRYFRGDVP
uniref:Reverse transcriptase domain-containing protein n=1 Tax=Tanacetum cinerariifolium TaxID=118510 RepID=A0A6L2LXQ2_TANCI|nr:reverse transcriptase domain-containing protein [Tanacetum cinerariifolium]